MAHLKVLSQAQLWAFFTQTFSQALNTHSSALLVRTQAGSNMRKLSLVALWLFLTFTGLAQTTPTARYDTVAQMVAATIPNVPASASGKISALVTGRVTANDGGGGVFYFTPASVSATNFGTVFPSTGVSGRWFRQYSESVDVKWFGAVGDGQVDCTSAITNCISVASSSGSKMLISYGTYLVTSELQLPHNLFISGEGRPAGVTNNISTIYSKHSGRSALSLAGSTGVRLQDFTIQTDSATFPKAVLLLGRTSAGSAGLHVVQNINILGSATYAGIYAIASEENSYKGLFVSVTAPYAFFTSQDDDLSLGGLTGSSNIGVWLSDSRLQVFSSSTNSAVIQIHGGVATQGHSYRNSFLAAGNGVYVRVALGTDIPGNPSNLIFDGLGGEPSAGGYAPLSGFQLTCVSANPYTLSDSVFNNCKLVGTAGSSFYFNTYVSGGSASLVTLSRCRILASAGSPSNFGNVLGSEISLVNPGDITASSISSTVVTTTNNWAFGLTLPTHKVDIAGPVSASPITNGIVRILGVGSNPATGSGGGLTLGQQDSAGNYVDYASITGRRVNSAANDEVDLDFNTGSPTGGTPLAARMTVKAINGYVGIGLTDPDYRLVVTGDANTRIRLNGSASSGIYFNHGAADAGTIRGTTSGLDFFVPSAGNILNLASSGSASFIGDVVTLTAGFGLKIKEGSNARMGRSALVNGTVTVANTSVTASTEIFLTRRIQAGTTVGVLSVGTVTAATSFVINSLDLAGSLSADDDSTVNWLLIEPSP